MDVVEIAGMTAKIGEQQGYIGLPIRAGTINCAVNGPNTPTITTAWKPTAEEILKIIAGAEIHVRLLCRQHPPIMLEVHHHGG